MMKNMKEGRFHEEVMTTYWCSVRTKLRYEAFKRGKRDLSGVITQKSEI